MREILEDHKRITAEMVQAKAVFDANMSLLQRQMVELRKKCPHDFSDYQGLSWGGDEVIVCKLCGETESW